MSEDCYVSGPLDVKGVDFDPVETITVSVNGTSGVISTSSALSAIPIINNMELQFVGSAPAPFSLGTEYYTTGVSGSTFQLTTSATGTTPVIVPTQSGNYTLTGDLSIPFVVNYYTVDNGGNLTFEDNRVQSRCHYDCVNGIVFGTVATTPQVDFGDQLAGATSNPFNVVIQNDWVDGGTDSGLGYSNIGYTILGLTYGAVTAKYNYFANTQAKMLAVTNCNGVDFEDNFWRNDAYDAGNYEAGNGTGIIHAEFSLLSPTNTTCGAPQVELNNTMVEDATLPSPSNVYIIAAGYNQSPGVGSTVGNFQLNTIASNNLIAPIGTGTFVASNPSISVPGATSSWLGITVTLQGTLPSGFSRALKYYVVSAGTGTIELSATSMGSPISPTTSGTATVMGQNWTPNQSYTANGMTHPTETASITNGAPTIPWAGNSLQDGQIVAVSGASLPPPFTATNYYVINSNSSGFQLTSIYGNSSDIITPTGNGNLTATQESLGSPTYYVDDILSYNNNSTNFCDVSYTAPQMIVAGVELTNGTISTTDGAGPGFAYYVWGFKGGVCVNHADTAPAGVTAAPTTCLLNSDTGTNPCGGTGALVTANAGWRNHTTADNGIVWGNLSYAYTTSLNVNNNFLSTNGMGTYPIQLSNEGTIQCTFSGYTPLIFTPSSNYGVDVNGNITPITLTGFPTGTTSPYCVHP